ncbi:MAG: hypothetical protein JWL62_3805 [Hyphomicrobiales bacterium]|nr:hypothetical protein [Hyphomicrobiales bacterium]
MPYTSSLSPVFSFHVGDGLKLGRCRVVSRAGTAKYLYPSNPQNLQKGLLRIFGGDPGVTYLTAVSLQIAGPERVLMMRRGFFRANSLGARKPKQPQRGTSWARTWPYSSV